MEKWVLKGPRISNALLSLERHKGQSVVRLLQMIIMVYHESGDQKS